MKFTGIHQFTPVFSKNDAIGNTVFKIKKAIENWGYESKIFVEIPIQDTSNIAKKHTDYEPKKTDFIIYHHSIGSELVDFVCDLKNIKVLCYHNITKPEFFQNYDNKIATQLQDGINQLRKLSKYFKFAMGASSYTKLELQNYGFKNILPFEYFIHQERFDNLTPKKDIIKQYENSINIIFVGRKVPNKKIEDILKVFAYYKIFNPKSKLFLLGGSWAVEKYVKELEDLIQLLKLNKNDVITVNTLTDEELFSYYKVSDLFLCMSEHEGFCIPLVEAMYLSIPIVAYNSTSIPNTLGGNGVLVNHKKYSEIAQIIDSIVSNRNIYDEIVSRQNKHVKIFNNKSAIETLKNTLNLIMKDSINS